MNENTWNEDYYWKDDDGLRRLMTFKDPTKDAPDIWNLYFKPRKLQDWTTLTPKTKEAFIIFLGSYIEDRRTIDMNSMF